MYWDPEFFGKRRFLKRVALLFQWIYDEYIQGRARKGTVSMPPRAGKSYITSLFCAWWLGKFPALSVMRNCCTSTLYVKFSYDVRAIIKDPRYQKIFPSAKLSADKQNIDGWNLTTAKQVSYFGAGVGGTIIGFGANLALYDDLYKDISAARSETVLESTDMWKQSAHNSRMEKNCPEIGIGTRWSQRDEIGKANEAGKIDIEISIPALAVGEDGQLESFCEDVKSTEEYLKIKEDTDEEIWEAEYMQNPIEIKGLLFPKSQLKFYDPEHLERMIAQKKKLEGEYDGAGYKYQHIDPADTGGDFLSAPVCNLLDKAIYVSDVVFNTDGTDVTIPTLVELICNQKLNAVEIEGNSGWRLFGVEVRNKVTEEPPAGRGYEDCEIRIIKNSTNKETRILAESAFIKNHFYFRSDYEKVPEYRMFIKKLTSYMREGKNQEDGAPDSLAGCAKHFKTRFSHLW